jgi:hypothetical protein
MAGNGHITIWDIRSGEQNQLPLIDVRPPWRRRSGATRPLPQPHG